MPGKDYSKTEEQASQSQIGQHPESSQSPEAARLLSTIGGVFSAFREQIKAEAPNPFSDNAKRAVATFKDIVARLRFETRPRAIQDLSGRPLSSTEIQLAWTDIVGNADGYRIERFIGSDNLRPIDVGQVQATERSFVDSFLSPNTIYGYRVIAFNFRGESSSGPISVMTSSISSADR